MTERRNDNDHNSDAKLEALYREARNIEPDEGLDRIIRARADEAVEARRSPRRLQWLGGLVTASVAIVALGVVLEQTPPAEKSPASRGSAPEVREPAAFMAPSLGADAALESSDETRRARSETRQMQPDAGAPQPVPPPSSAVLGAQVPSRSEKERTERLADIVDEQAADVVEPARPVSESIAEDPEAMLERIESLIERDKIERARGVLEKLRREYPRYDIPEDIERALAGQD